MLLSDIFLIVLQKQNFFYIKTVVPAGIPVI